jgi:hypothetical protein
MRFHQVPNSKNERDRIVASEGNNINKVLLVLVSLLMGVAMTGVSMVVRGDALGKEAAAATEKRLEKRMDREYLALRETLRRIEGKLDER